MIPDLGPVTYEDIIAAGFFLFFILAWIYFPRPPNRKEPGWPFA